MKCPSGLPERIDGVQGSAEGSLASDETAIRFAGSGWVQCPLKSHKPGVAQGRAAGPLPRCLVVPHTSCGQNKTGFSGSTLMIRWWLVLPSLAVMLIPIGLYRWAQTNLLRA